VRLQARFSFWRLCFELEFRYLLGWHDGEAGAAVKFPFYFFFSNRYCHAAAVQLVFSGTIVCISSNISEAPFKFAVVLCTAQQEEETLERVGTLDLTVVSDK
jgi:hypothetical protein